MQNLISSDEAANQLLEGKLTPEEYASILDPRGAGIYAGSIICRQIKELLKAILCQIGIKK